MVGNLIIYLAIRTACHYSSIHKSGLKETIESNRIRNILIWISS